jgi:hypothetical protein
LMERRDGPEGWGGVEGGWSMREGRRDTGTGRHALRPAITQRR